MQRREILRKHKAFTMLEILIVLAMLGVLTSIIMVKYPATTKRARDLQRASDLKSYQNALELYAMKNDGLYPTSGPVAVTSLCTELGITGSSCKNDPKGGNYYYETNTAGTKYTTWSTSEQSSGTIVVCSGGLNGVASVTPASGVCPSFASENTPTPTSSVVPSNTPVPTSTPTNTPTPTTTPTPEIKYFANSASGSSCATVCSNNLPGSLCKSAGTNVNVADNKKYYNSSCVQVNNAAFCDTSMLNSGVTCSGKMTNWTYCKCQK